MRLGSKQLATLTKLRKQHDAPWDNVWLIRANLLTEIELPDINALYYKDPDNIRYLSAKASFSRSMKRLINHGLIEKQRRSVDDGMPTALCYRITPEGITELDKRG
jgi:DNA-binding MarR family transcriptional regulator